MNRTFEYKDYTNYGFEDFLQDSFFVESMKKPSEETIAFWKSTENTLKNQKDFIAAQNYIKSLEAVTGDNSLSDDEVSLLWNRIDSHTTEQRTNNRNLNFYWKYISIAASVLIILSVGGFSYYFWDSKHNNIVSFAMKDTKTKQLPDDEAVLILSDDKQVRLKEDESTVSYNDSIQVITVKDKTGGGEAIDKNEATAYNQLVTPKGKRTSLILADGSKVWLNAGTRVVYPKEFESDRREIFVDGEIYIEVTPDKERPFYVKTKELDVRVLGTRFDVISYPDEASEKVILVSGSVIVDNRDNRDNSAKLVPNQMYETNGVSMKVRNVDAERYVSWIHGLYMYEDKPIDEILQGLCRYYGVQIAFANKEDNMKYSGKLDLKQSFDELLDGLKNISPIEYTKEATGKYIINFKQ